MKALYSAAAWTIAVAAAALCARGLLFFARPPVDVVLESRATHACLKAFSEALFSNRDGRTATSPVGASSREGSGADATGGRLNILLRAHAQSDNKTLAEARCTVDHAARVETLSTRFVDAPRLATLSLADIRLAIAKPYSFCAACYHFVARYRTT